jgi:hypothetical protein
LSSVAPAFPSRRFLSISSLAKLAKVFAVAAALAANTRTLKA